MSEEQGASSKIANPDRISRLVSRMCDGNMQVLIRHRDSGKVTIRGAFIKMGKINQVPVLQLGKISEAGLTKFEKSMPLKVEVLGMASQLTFQTVILDKTDDGIVCSMPLSLINTERRTNTRFRCTPKLMAFMSFGFWKARENDPSSPPFFASYGGIPNWIGVADISVGGVCLITRFPAFLHASEEIVDKVEAFLHLPMSQPLPMTGYIRWRRKIKNRSEDDSLGERFMLEYRIGFEFADVGEDQQQKIRHFIRQLTVAEAI